MTALTWDAAVDRRYETGVDHGVLYIPNNNGEYVAGYAWNGLISVSEAPEGAESNKQYADNIEYLNLLSAEQFKATVEAYTYPTEFEQCDGLGSPEDGVTVGQQTRKAFGLSYRTKVGNALNADAGYKIHIIYGCLAAPSEKAFNTINDSPEALTFSWEISTSSVPVGTIGGVTYKPTATLVVDSTKVDADALADLEEILYGTSGSDPELPTPAAIVALFAGTVTTVTATTPTYVDATDTLTIPSVTGVEYRNDVTNEPFTAGPHVISADTLVKAYPLSGYRLTPGRDRTWWFDYTP